MEYKDVEFLTKDNVRLHAWLIMQTMDGFVDSKDLPYTVLFFHGNAGNIGHRLENFRDMYRKLRVNIFALDYRGYGDWRTARGPASSACSTTQKRRTNGLSKMLG